MKVIRYIKELEDEKGKPLNKWAVYEETITQKGNWVFPDAKIVKTFPPSFSGNSGNPFLKLFYKKNFFICKTYKKSWKIFRHHLFPEKYFFYIFLK